MSVKSLNHIEVAIMRYKQILLGVIASVLCLGLLNGCSGYSHDFNSSEEAQKYVLAKLKDKYNEEFIITEVKKYKEEKNRIKLDYGGSFQ